VPLIFDDADLTQPAMAIARDLDHPVYDCVYLALARRRHAPLVTLDRRLTARLADTAYQCDAVLLADWTGS
jgi:predicted nucleic acid-binding protein